MTGGRASRWARKPLGGDVGKLPEGTPPETPHAPAPGPLPHGAVPAPPARQERPGRSGRNPPTFPPRRGVLRPAGRPGVLASGSGCLRPFLASFRRGAGLSLSRENAEGEGSGSGFCLFF